MEDPIRPTNPAPQQPTRLGSRRLVRLNYFFHVAFLLWLSWPEARLVLHKQTKEKQAVRKVTKLYLPPRPQPPQASKKPLQPRKPTLRPNLAVKPLSVAPPAPPAPSAPPLDRWSAGYVIEGTDAELQQVLRKIDGWVGFAGTKGIVGMRSAPEWEPAAPGEVAQRIQLSVSGSNAINALRSRAGAEETAEPLLLVKTEFFNELWEMIEEKRKETPNLTAVAFARLRLAPENDHGIVVVGLDPPPAQDASKP